MKVRKRLEKSMWMLLILIPLYYLASGRGRCSKRYFLVGGPLGLPSTEHCIKKYFRVLDMKNVCMNYIDTTPQKLSFTFKLIKSKMNLEKK